MHIKSIIAASLLALSPAEAVFLTYNIGGPVAEGIFEHPFYDDFPDLRNAARFHGTFSYDPATRIDETMFPNNPVRVVDAAAEFNIARYNFSVGLDAWFPTITNNAEGDDFFFPPRFIGADIVRFINPNPHDQSVDGSLYKFMDDASILFIDPTGTLLNNGESLEGVDLALFPIKIWDWTGALYNIAATDPELSELNPAGVGGTIDKMVLVRRVPDTGSTLGLLGFAIAGLGFLKRKLS